MADMLLIVVEQLMLWQQGGPLLDGDRSAGAPPGQPCPESCYQLASTQSLLSSQCAGMVL